MKAASLVWMLLAATLAWSQSAAPPQSEPCSNPSAIHKLSEAKRIYVDSFGEDPVSKKLQAALVAELLTLPGLTGTENKGRADVILRGTGTESTTQEVHSSSEATKAGRAAIADSSTNTETISRAQVSLR